MYDVFLKTGVAHGSRRTLGHIGEAGLKGRENCKERKGCGIRAFAVFPSVGLGLTPWACWSLPCLLLSVAETVRFCLLDLVLIGRAQ